MEPSPDIKSIITLLNNADDLIVISSKRAEASDVMDAIKIFAKSHHVELPEDQIEDFYDLLYDSRPNTLSGLLRNIAHTLITQDKLKKG